MGKFSVTFSFSFCSIMALLSTKKTLDYLVSDINSKHETNDTNSVHSDNQQNIKKKRNSFKHHHQRSSAPPLIPPSPKTKPDDTAQTELILKQFVLDSANETWEENTIKKSELKNKRWMKEQMVAFGLNTVKYEYQSLIKHTNINKTKITELIEEG